MIAMTQNNADIHTLQLKLQEHIEQLAHVQALLEQNPHDEELAKLKEDLEQVVKLTEDLTEVKQTELEEAAKAEGLDVATFAQQLIGHSLYPPEEKWKVGDRCMALWEDRKYWLARIDEINGDEYNVTYLDYGNQSTVPESSLKPFEPVHKEALKAGQLVKAMFAEDKLFYDAIILGKADAPGYYLVRFNKFSKKKYEVSSYDLTLRAGKKVPNPNEPLPDRPIIPDNIKVKPTDSDAVKNNKFRKIKRIKNQHRKRKLEEAGQRKQANWLSFIKTAKTGYGKKKKSIFSSIDSADPLLDQVEGRIGVIAGGGKMTQNPNKRKHRFKDLELVTLEEEDMGARFT